MPGHLAKPYLRQPFQKIMELVDYRQIVVLTGLRRVGKSTLMFQAMDRLIGSGVDPLRILYYSFDEKALDPLKILDGYSGLTGLDWRKERIYVFFDEIQKLEGWSSKIKLLYDNVPGLKFFLSGSGGLMLEKNAVSDLVGRYFLIRVDPLSLREFFEMSTGRSIAEEEVGLWRAEIARHLNRFIERPFPEIIGWEDKMRIREYIRESVIEKIVGGDLPRTFRGVREDSLLSLLEIFYQNPGLYLNTDSLARSLRMSKKNLLKHLFYLEFAYLTKTIRNYRPSLLASSRKLRRVYPYHWSLIFGFHVEVERGKLLESIVASLLNPDYYWREGGKEVDFLVRKDQRIIPVEIKASESIEREDTKNLGYFLEKFGMREGCIVYLGRERETVRMGDKILRQVPLVDLALFGGEVIESSETRSSD